MVAGSTKHTCALEHRAGLVACDVRARAPQEAGRAQYLRARAQGGARRVGWVSTRPPR